jgi:hypothetical protein
VPKKETAQTPEKAEKDIMNGVTRPSAETSSGRVWEIADALSHSTGEPAKRSDVLAQTQLEEINSATASTQYGRWRKYNGLESISPRKAKDAEETVEEDEDEAVDA